MSAARSVVRITEEERSRLDPTILAVLDDGWQLGRAHSIVLVLVCTHQTPSALTLSDLAVAASQTLLLGGADAWTKYAAGLLDVHEYGENQRAWLLARTLDALYSHAAEAFPSHSPSM